MREINGKCNTYTMPYNTNLLVLALLSIALLFPRDSLLDLSFIADTEDLNHLVKGLPCDDDDDDDDVVVVVCANIINQVQRKYFERFFIFS